MKNKKFKQSEENHFFASLEKMELMHGVIGREKYNPKEERFDGIHKFVVVDKNFKVLFEHVPFGKGGNYHKAVTSKMKELKLSDRNNERNRCDEGIEEMINNLETHLSLKWIAPFWSGNTLETMKVSRDGFDVEESSPEFEHLKKICHYMDRAIKPLSDSNLDKGDIEYEYHTESGKLEINEAIEWFKNNTSKTPIQDAWFALLRSRGVVVDWEPYLLNDTGLPVMRNVTYASKEELDRLRELKMQELRASISPELREQLKKTAARLSAEK